MERLQGPLNSCLFGEHLGVNCLEQGFTEEGEQSLISSLEEDNMPFLQMLQSAESPTPFFPFKDPSFQKLARLHHLKNPREGIPYIPRLGFGAQKSSGVESNDDLQQQQQQQQQQQHSALCSGKAKSGEEDYCCSKDAHEVGSTSREIRRKRKRAERQSKKKMKNEQDIENQRITHIATERNRRRQMNDHLTVLKSLMSPSYIQRGDHASIIGGAIDFVKELEQLLQSLETQRRVRRKEEEVVGTIETSECGMSSSMKAERKSEGGAIEVTVIQNHANLKIECERRHGQLLKAIVALEQLSLTILHLNITSSHASVFYSFNLKIEEESKVGSAYELAEAVERILRFINGS